MLSDVAHSVQELDRSFCLLLTLITNIVVFASDLDCPRFIVSDQTGRLYSRVGYDEPRELKLEPSLYYIQEIFLY